MLTFGEIMGMVYLRLTVVGCLGTCILLFLNAINFLIVQRTRPKHLIFIHFAFSNAMVLLFREIPTTTDLWRVKCLLHETGIRIITYLQILTQGLSLVSICLLSVFQAITISPSNSIWVQLRMRAPKYIIPCIVLCWIFNLLLDVVILLYYDGQKNTTNSKYVCNTGYRTIDVYNENHIKFAIIICVHDALFVFLMTCSSVHMILILYRHKRNVNYIHNKISSTKISPETRATQAILFLVATFVLLNVFSPILISHMLYFKYVSTWMLHTSVVLSLLYPAVSPFILISIGNQIPRTCVC
ncbi:vomeronasal type-1 receptor 3-like [Vombatus ursinus]|uniref:vomeronasal type-1 receptor 3-like n=1 Tax=Vombatus ursinus TaxID=29139 RepID=UPI000FFD3EC3|nr:vomeronasal type-1 receptor 3-like [Vombatus ursinus]